MTGLKKIIAVSIIAGLTMISYDVPSAQRRSPEQCQSVVGATTDLLMSDDMADYLTTVGSGQQAGEMDME